MDYLQGAGWSDSLARIIGRARKAHGDGGTPFEEDVSLVPLAAAHWLPEATGRKATRLAELIDAGYRVPPGFVLTRVVACQAENALEGMFLTRDEQRQFDRSWKAIGGGPVAVRLSGENGDCERADFSSTGRTVLDVHRAGLESAVRDVRAPREPDRPTTQTEPLDGCKGESGAAVIVQRMVAAEHAGVMFTEHPGTSGAMLIEVDAGRRAGRDGEALSPDAFAFGKLSGERISDGAADTRLPPMDLEPLLVLGREIELHFGRPQDIKWVYADGEFHLLQARDSTRVVTCGDTPRQLGERERARLIRLLLGDCHRARRGRSVAVEAPLLLQNELTAKLPRPTPLSADLMARLWAAGGSADIACNELGIPYDVHYDSVPYIVTVFGWTYVNLQEGARRLGKGPSALATRRLSRDARETRRAFRDDFLPRFQKAIAERDAIEMEQLSLTAAIDLFRSWIEGFVVETSTEAERIAIAAEFHTKSAAARLTAARLDPARYLHTGCEAVAAEAMSRLTKVPPTRASVEEFLVRFGHRAPMASELAMPRFREDVNLARRQFQPAADSTIALLCHEESFDADSALADLPSDRVLRAAVRRAREFTGLEEAARDCCMCELAQLRALLMVIDNRAELGGKVFQLRIDEVLELGDPDRRAELEQASVSRLAESARHAARKLPTSLSIADLERVDMLTGKRPGAPCKTALGGKRVVGEQAVSGTVRLIGELSDTDSLEPGEILVTRMTDPRWEQRLSRAAAIVTEIGGWTSHTAIIAHHEKLPAIVGAAGACRILRTGEYVTLNVDGTIERRDESPGGTAESATRRRFRKAAARRIMKARLAERIDKPADTDDDASRSASLARSRAANALSAYRAAA